MSVHRFFLAAAAFVLVAGAALASPAPAKPFNISTPESFHAQLAQVQAGMQAGGAYAFLSARNRARVEEQIATMSAMFQRHGNIQAMDDAQRVELYNAQETANHILTRGREGNVRCAWIPPTGSHVAKTHCWRIDR